MRADNIFDIVVALCSWEQADKADYTERFIGILNARLAEAFTKNNAMRAARGAEALSDIPVITALEDEVPYEPRLLLHTLPLGVAGYLYVDDDETGISNVYREDYQKALMSSEKAQFTDAEEYKTFEALGELIKQEYPATPEEALTAPGGSFFHEFRRDVHAIEPFEIPAHWRRYHAIHYGLDMLASLWGAVDPEGSIYIYREVYKSDLVIKQAAEAILSAEDEGESICAEMRFRT